MLIANMTCNLISKWIIMNQRPHSYWWLTILSLTNLTLQVQRFEKLRYELKIWIHRWSERWTLVSLLLVCYCWLVVWFIMEWWKKLLGKICSLIVRHEYTRVYTIRLILLIQDNRCLNQEWQSQFINRQFPLT
jgi:hypothetical protein